MAEYPDRVPARLRYRLCPHCGQDLVNFADEEGIARTRCPACGALRDGREGRVAVHPFGAFPALAAERRGSARILSAFVTSR